MKQIWISKAGAPEVLEVREAPDPQPGEGEVRIRVAASGVNFADIMARIGIYPDAPPIPCVVGYEVAGTIDAAGQGADESLVGKDVIALVRFGGYSDTVCVPAEQVVIRPQAMTAEEGAAIPVVYVTAYMLVEVMGGLRQGETVLIHSAGGGVGIAAIQLAQRIGARVIGTASAGKHGYLKSIGVEHCIDYTREDFEQRVREITNGAGVELILDAVGGDSFKKSYRSLARSGRLGMFGISSAATGKRRSVIDFVKMGLTMPWFTFNAPELMNSNKGVFGVNLGHMWREGPRIRGWLADLMRYFDTGAIKPHVDKTFAFSDAAAAHHYIQDRKNLGKVLLKP